VLETAKMVLQGSGVQQDLIPTIKDGDAVKRDAKARKKVQCVSTDSDGRLHPSWLQCPRSEWC
jgi:hypothetical protein